MPNSEPEEAAAEATEEAPTTRATRSSKRRPSGGDWPEAKRPKNDNDDNEIKRPTPLEYLEDYVEFTANLLLPDDAADLPTYHAVPVVSALHYLKHNPKRRKLVWEDWSPYQVCLFEAALAHHGKDFYAIAKEFGEGVKSTQQVIDFYYVWKKTSHYKKWQKTFLPKSMDYSTDEEAEEHPHGLLESDSGKKK